LPNSRIAAEQMLATDRCRLKRTGVPGGNGSNLAIIGCWSWSDMNEPGSAARPSRDDPMVYAFEVEKWIAIGVHMKITAFCTRADEQCMISFPT
jgi:hypothetical protein